MFEDWLLASGFPEGPSFVARKSAILRVSLGAEGFRLYSSMLPDVATRESYGETVGRLKKHFATPVSAIFARAQFTRHQQRPGQSVANYVASLREMAAKCEFAADQINERVRDQFVAWVASDKIRERLLQEPATKSLDDLLQLALTIERAMAEAPALTASTPSSSLTTQPEAAVGAISRAKFGSNHNRKSLPPPPLPTRQQPTFVCYNCGLEGHTPRSDQCAARGKDCLHCGKVGHFAKCCRQRIKSHRGQGRGKSSRPKSGLSANTNHIADYTDEETNNDVGSIYINSVEAVTPGEFRRVDALVNSVPISLVIDLGAKVSIISKAFYDQHLTHVKVRPAIVKLRAYQGQNIECIGCVILNVEANGLPPLRFRFHISTWGQSLMGIDLFDALGGAVRLGDTTYITDTSAPSDSSLEAAVGEVNPMTSSSTVALADYPTLLKDKGTLCTFVHKPQIDPSVRPVQQKFWHPPLAMREPIASELQRLERDGIIERVESSPWISNIVTARKKDGGVRLCVNLTAVNKALIPERYPLPTMEELTEKIAGCTVFSKVDLLWGYLQLRLAPEVRYLTAFVSHIGCFQYTSLPFGLATGPSAFHQVIRKILDGLPGCASILDDILVFGTDMADHDRKLRAVLNRLSQFNATVRVDKCVIGKPEVEFNGHVISASGIRPLQSNVDGILRIPTPTNQKELIRFLCTAAYYLKFVKAYADLCEPLRQLTRSGALWIWTDRCQSAFEEIKRQLASAPVLAHFDTSADTILTCDASATAIGACLSQRHADDVIDRPVAYISRALTPAERRYSASEREALSCMWACERLNFYLYGRRFRLVTDHQALTTLLSAGGTGHRPLRLHRWADRLLQYNFDVTYKPGTENVIADCLSRSYDENATTATSSLDTAADEADALIQTAFGSFTTTTVTLDQIAAATDVDETLSKVREHVLTAWPMKRQQLQSELRPYFDIRAELSVWNRCIVRGLRTIIPESLAAAILDLAHEGHPGVVKMKQRCRESVWWPGIDRDVELFVRNCTACITSGKSIKPHPGPLQPVPLPTGPWTKIAIDIAGEFVAAPHHQRYVIAAIDLYSKWPEAAACGSPTSSAVIEFLTSLFDRFGLVQEVVTDNGVQFVSSEFEDFLAAHAIKHTKLALYAPQANATERLNRVLKEGIKAAVAEGKPFITGLRQTLAAYRSMPQGTTGVSPASLMLAFPMRMPLTVAAPPRDPATRLQQSSQSELRARVEAKQQTMAQQHDRRTGAIPSTIRPGDSVRILLPKTAHKLAQIYSEPRSVVKVRGNTVWLQDGKAWNIRRCLLHRLLINRSSKDQTASATGRANPSSTPDTGESNTGDDADDAPAFGFNPPPPGAPPEPRRSSRHHRPRDFGRDFIMY